jgi:hypothetical protein
MPTICEAFLGSKIPLTSFALPCKDSFQSTLNYNILFTKLKEEKTSCSLAVFMRQIID